MVFSVRLGSVDVCPVLFGYCLAGYVSFVTNVLVATLWVEDGYVQSFHVDRWVPVA